MADDALSVGTAWGACVTAGLAASVPGTIHGRRDISGPALVPWRLHCAWPASKLIIDEGDGHGGDTMMHAWCEATGRHAEKFDSGRG